MMPANIYLDILKVYKSQKKLLSLLNTINFIMKSHEFSKKML